jgi:hypothetical protein
MTLRATDSLPLGFGAALLPRQLLVDRDLEGGMHDVAGAIQR